MATPAPNPASDAPLPKNTEDGRYIFKRKLGSGNMGEVFVARDTLFERDVAIKVLLWNRQSAEMRKRFELEAKTMARLAGARNICQVIDMRFEGDQIYVIMELIQGKTLLDYMCNLPLGGDKAPKVPTFDAVRFMTGLLTGLAAAHAIGVVHRDLKPENLMITGDGVLKILDFGIAQHADVQLTRTQMTMGNYAYSAPEQLEDAKSVDHRADLYAAGVIFYTMLTGDGNTLAFYSTMLSEPARLAKIPAFKEFLLTACAKDREQRYQDAMAMITGLEAAMRGYLSMTPADHVSEEVLLTTAQPAVQPVDGVNLPEPHIGAPAQSERRLAKVIQITRPPEPAVYSDLDVVAPGVAPPPPVAFHTINEPAKVALEPETLVAPEPEVMTENPAIDVDGLGRGNRPAGTVYIPAAVAAPMLEEPPTPPPAQEPEVVEDVASTPVTPPASKPELRVEEPLRDIFEDDEVEPPRKRPVAVIVGVVAVIATAWFAWPQPEPTQPVAEAPKMETAVEKPVVAAAVAPSEPVPVPQEIAAPPAPEAPVVLGTPTPVTPPASKPQTRGKETEVSKVQATKPTTVQKPKPAEAAPTPVAKGPVLNGGCKVDGDVIAYTASVTPAVPGAKVRVYYRVGENGAFQKKVMPVAGSDTYATTVKVDEAMKGSDVYAFVSLMADGFDQPLTTAGENDSTLCVVTP